MFKVSELTITIFHKTVIEQIVAGKIRRVEVRTVPRGKKARSWVDAEGEYQETTYPTFLHFVVAIVRPQVAEGETSVDQDGEVLFKYESPERAEGTRSYITNRAAEKIAAQEEKFKLLIA